MVWKSVPDFEARYEVSDTGRIRSLDREIIPRSGPAYFIKGRERKQCKIGVVTSKYLFTRIIKKQHLKSTGLLQQLF